MSESFKSLQEVKASEIKPGDIIVLQNRFWTVLSLPDIPGNGAPYRIAFYCSTPGDDGELESSVLWFFRSRTIRAYV